MSSGVLVKIPQARVTPSVAGASSALAGAQQARTAGQESVPERAGSPAGAARGQRVPTHEQNEEGAGPVTRGAGGQTRQCRTVHRTRKGPRVEKEGE